MPLREEEKRRDKSRGEGEEDARARDDLVDIDTALAFANGAAVPISGECVRKWHLDRQRLNWTWKKGTDWLPITDWRADLRAFARSWNDLDRQARSAGTNGAVPTKEKPTLWL